MKNKKGNKPMFVVSILMIIFLVMLYFYMVPMQKETVNASNNTVKTVAVTKQTIRKEITGSGEISSNLQERLFVNKNRYLKEVYMEENQIVKKGENLLKYTNGSYLVAPYDLAIVNLNLGKIGELCDANSQYIEVLDTTNLIITLNINESDKNNIAVGQEVHIKANTFENKEYIGKVKKIDAIGKYGATGSSFKVTIAFENDGLLSIGMSAFCQIIVSEAKNVLALPIEAIKNIGEEKWVTVVNEDGTTKEVKVETGLSNDNYVEIKSGLEDGQEVQYVPISKNSSLSNMQKASMDLTAF